MRMGSANGRGGEKKEIRVFFNKRNALGPLFLDTDMLRVVGDWRGRIVSAHVHWG